MLTLGINEILLFYLTQFVKTKKQFKYIILTKIFQNYHDVLLEN